MCLAVVINYYLEWWMKHKRARDKVEIRIVKEAIGMGNHEEEPRMFQFRATDRRTSPWIFGMLTLKGLWIARETLHYLLPIRWADWKLSNVGISQRISLSLTTEQMPLSSIPKVVLGRCQYDLSIVLWFMETKKIGTQYKSLRGWAVLLIWPKVTDILFLRNVLPVRMLGKPFSFVIMLITCTNNRRFSKHGGLILETHFLHKFRPMGKDKILFWYFNFFKKSLKTFLGWRPKL